MIEYNFQAHGMLFDYWTTGMAIFTGVVVVANLELFNLHNVHTPWTILIIFSSISLYLITLLVFGFFKGNPLYQIFGRLAVTPQFYAYMLISVYLLNIIMSSIYKITNLFGKVELRKGLLANEISTQAQRPSDFTRRYTGFAYSG
jgi:hypothetical protein